MRLNPEFLRKVAERTAYGSFWLNIFLAGCQPAPEAIRSYPDKPAVTLYPLVECVKGEPRNISVGFEAETSIDPLVVRIYDPEERVGTMQEVSPTRAPHKGTLNFHRMSYTGKDGKEVVKTFENGKILQVSAFQKSVVSQNGGVISAIRPLTPSKELILNCQK